MNRIFASPLDEVSLVKRDQLGAIREEGGKWYKYVNIRNVTATVAGVAGDGVAYASGTGYLNNRVVVDLSDADATKALAAGVLAAAVAGVAGTDYYGWIQIKGQRTLAIAVTGGVAGQGFNLTTVDKTFAVNALVTDQKAGYSLNGTTSVVLDCPF